MSQSFLAPAATPDLYDLVWFPNGDWCDELAIAALPENWDDDGSGRHPILFNYIKYYVRRVLEEGLWAETAGPSGMRLSAFDTGLLSRHFEPIYAVFEANRNPARQPWVHKEWASPSSPRLRDFDLSGMRRALFFSSPAEAVYDPRLPVLPNLEHIIDDNVDRYPADLQRNAYLRKAVLENAIQVAAAKARSNWRLAAPQFYWPAGSDAGRVQLLLPLSLLNPDHVDLALVIDRSPSYADQPEAANACYRAYTVLPLEWAYRNARLIARPEALWLDLNTRTAAGASESIDDGQGGWRPARAHDRCPVCGAVSGCLLRADNREVACRNTESGRPHLAQTGSTIWLHEWPWSAAAGLQA